MLFQNKKNSLKVDASKMDLVDGLIRFTKEKDRRATYFTKHMVDILPTQEKIPLR